ncbi:hypothetical protein CBR_g49937 [Chara braunii]|uniref:Integrase catalytic domain-containing protein n=1 Tax=Chara braunii TaxID=69332 RepID=A0A388JPN5_CHABU|nr:hypothetical protein CBR_g49937 [Chara braunii]|eukprot:GBG59672.1 hypothetical protein CBR_g49937 [Chara braunii]
MALRGAVRSRWWRFLKLPQGNRLISQEQALFRSGSIRHCICEGSLLCRSKGPPLHPWNPSLLAVKMTSAARPTLVWYGSPTLMTQLQNICTSASATTSRPPEPPYFFRHQLRYYNPSEMRRLEIASRASRMQAKRFWSLILGGTAISAFVILLLNTFQENLMFYITPTQALEKFREQPSKSRFRLGGLVVEGRIFHDHLDKFVVVYLDDILIFSKSVEEHAQHVETVLSLSRQHKYKVNLEKCEFGSTKILYLVHEVSAEGIRSEDAKVASIRDWPRPQTVTKVRSFLGMCSYYRNFVKNYSTVASPLTDLTRLDTPWDWSDECEAAFKRLKHALMNHEVLMVPDPQKPFIVTTDASQYGIGAVLAQQDGKKLRPIEYMSKKMPSKKLAKSTYERQLYALYKALVHWRHFLLGRFFYLRTDHQTLKWIKTQPALSDALKRWIEVIDHYNFKLEYLRGEYNKVADALSRRADYLGALVYEFGISQEVTQSLVGAYQEDPVMMDIMRKLQAKDKATKSEFVMVDGLLFLDKVGCKSPKGRDEPSVTVANDVLRNAVTANPANVQGHKKDEALDTWLRTVPVWVRAKRTLVEEEVITAASYLEGSTSRWLNGLVASKEFGRNMGDWPQNDTLESFVDLVEARWHNPQQAQIATDGLLKLDVRKPFVVTTDASQYGIGALVAQQEGKKLRPIEYMSKKMPSKKLAKSTYERELYALYKALVHWRHYLLGRFFYLRTDHQTPKWIKTQPVLFDALKRWIEVIDQYDFKLDYVKGEYNKVADALSRRADYLGALIYEFGLSDNVTRSLGEAYKEDPITMNIINKLRAKDEATTDEFVMVDGLLFLEKAGLKRLVVPSREDLRSLFLGECHAAMGHFDYKKTSANLVQRFWWPNMLDDVKKYVETFQVCQRDKPRTQAPLGLLKPLPIPAGPGQSISIDFMDTLVTSKNGKRHIFVIVDRFTKYARLIAMPETARTEHVIKLFMVLGA